MVDGDQTDLIPCLLVGSEDKSATAKDGDSPTSKISEGGNKGDKTTTMTLRGSPKPLEPLIFSVLAKASEANAGLEKKIATVTEKAADVHILNGVGSLNLRPV